MNDLEPIHDLELNISRLVDVSPSRIYRCWTEQDLLVQWFTPAPWKTTGCTIDPRAGGVFDVQMQGPDGEFFTHRGTYLEIVPNQKIVFTDALLLGWLPSSKPFVVATVTFAQEGGPTRYTSRVWHWTVADRDDHLERGFHDGWNKALDQLLAVAKELEEQAP